LRELKNTGQQNLISLIGAAYPAKDKHLPVLDTLLCEFACTNLGLIRRLFLVSAVEEMLDEVWRLLLGVRAAAGES
jgi:hypothetical protein